MTLAQIRKFAQARLAERFSEWGYQLNPQLNNFFTKQLTSEVTIGIFPRIYKNCDAYEFEFYFGVCFQPIEKAIDALGGAELRWIDSLVRECSMWTVWIRNLDFPDDYNIVTVAHPSYGATTSLTNNNTFVPGMKPEEVVERVKLNLNLIVANSLPRLEELNNFDIIFEKLKRQVQGWTLRLPVAYSFVNDISALEQVVERAQSSFSHPELRDHAFYKNLLQSIKG